jgi:hypothetical protein
MFGLYGGTGLSCFGQVFGINQTVIEAETVVERIFRNIKT